MHRNTMKQTKTLVWGPPGWIGCVRREKSWRDFVSRTFVLTAPVQYVLHQVSCKTYCRLGAFVAKNPMWLRGTNFCINCASSPCFAPSFMQLRNDPKCTQTLSNAPKHEFRVQWVDQVRSLQKVQTWHSGTNFCINCTCTVCFAISFMQLRNDPKCTQILRNGPKH